MGRGRSARRSVPTLHTVITTSGEHVMNQFVIHFIGIAMFLNASIGGVPDARHVVFPKFDQGATVYSPGHKPQNVEAHVPYLAFTTDACGTPPCVDTSHWPEAPKKFNRGTVKWAYVP